MCLWGFRLSGGTLTDVDQMEQGLWESDGVYIFTQNSREMNMAFTEPDWEREKSPGRVGVIKC